jgi:4-amino-4-deoxy-L-arabinose transferase-like glycosyltransferase
MVASLTRLNILFNSKKLGLLILGLLLAAILIRVWGFRFGLPYLYHFDEPTYVSAALNLGAGSIGKQPNPTGFSNFLFVEYGALFVFGRMLGNFNSLAEFEQVYRTDPSNFMIIARLTSIIFGGLTIPVVFYLGKEIRNLIVGLIAALFLLTSFLHIRDSHFAVPDITATFFVCLATLLSLISIQKNDPIYLGLTSVSTGLAITTKWNVWPIMLTLGLNIIFILRSSVKGKSGGIEKLFFFSIIGFGVGLLIGGFQLLLDPKIYLEYAIQEFLSGSSGGFGIWQVDKVSGWYFYLKILFWGIGSVVLILSIIGFVRRIITLSKSDYQISLIILSFPITYYLIMGSTRHYFARYALPLVPWLNPSLLRPLCFAFGSLCDYLRC